MNPLQRYVIQCLCKYIPKSIHHRTPRNKFICIFQNLERGRRAKPKIVSVPAYFRKWLNEAPPKTLFYFPWGDEIVVDRRFWECIVGTGAWISGWLRDEVRIN